MELMTYFSRRVCDFELYVFDGGERIICSDCVYEIGVGQGGLQVSSHMFLKRWDTSTWLR